MALKIFNTLHNEKEEFIPLTPGQVRMYVCGVTAYDSAHLGHCRFLLTFDVIYRYLLYSGFDVIYARNFTDVDDKIIKRANDERTTCAAITDRYIAEFERLLDEVARDEREPSVISDHLTSETGLVYTLLAQAAGRLA